MKKTLVAIAAAAAVTGAYAEVTISGFVDQAVQSTTKTSTAGAKSTYNTVGNNLIGQDALNFGVTEDLGDGMTAYANINTLLFLQTGQTGAYNTDSGSGVGLKGAFGNIFLGSDYNQVWKTMAAADGSGWGAGGGAAGSVWYNTNGVGNTPRIFSYTLPSMATGLDIVVEQGYGNTASGVGDQTGFSVSYTSGAFMAKYAGMSLKTTSGTTTFTTYDAAGSAYAVSGALTYDGSVAAYQVAALTYDLGVAKLFLGAESMSMNDSGDVAESKNTFGINVPFGATTLGWGHSSSTLTNNAGTQYQTSGDKLFAKYAFSKRTNAYFTYGKSSQTGSQIGLSNTSVGLTHSF